MNSEYKYNNFLLRSFPAIFSEVNPIFNFRNCSFKCEKSKEKTGRVVCFKELGIQHSFTLENTFYGRERLETDSDDIDLHMSVNDFKQIGKDLMNSLAYYQNEEFINELETEASKHLLTNVKVQKLQSNSLVDLTANAIKLDNDEPYKDSNVENFVEVESEFMPIFTKVNESMARKIKYTDDIKDNDSSSEDFSSDCEDEETNLLHGKIKLCEPKDDESDTKEFVHKSDTHHSENAIDVKHMYKKYKDKSIWHSSKFKRYSKVNNEYSFQNKHNFVSKLSNRSSIRINKSKGLDYKDIGPSKTPVRRQTVAIPSIQYPHQFPPSYHNEYENPPSNFNKSVSINGTITKEYFNDINQPYENISKTNFRIISDKIKHNSGGVSTSFSDKIKHNSGGPSTCFSDQKDKL